MKRPDYRMFYDEENTLEYKGYEILIRIHRAEDSGPPWKESEGHGEVSEWTSRDKAPGERILCDAGNNIYHRSRRYYDFAESMKIAKRDGWGFEGMNRETMTPGQIAAEAVERDFAFLRAWCNDDWHYVGYTTEITRPDGSVIDGDSCWGFDDAKYMLEEAFDIAKDSVDRDMALAVETELAHCWP